MKSEAGLSAGIFCFVWRRPTSFLVILPSSAASLPTAAQAGEQPTFAPVAPAAGTLARPLIVYLPRTRNTAALARITRRQTGGALAALEPQISSPQSYHATAAQAAHESDAGILPPLASLPAGLRTLFISCRN